MEMEGMAFEVEPLENVEDVEASEIVPSAAGEHPLQQLRERLKALEADIAVAEMNYEAQLAGLMRRVAEADARDAERKAVLQELLAKMK